MKQLNKLLQAQFNAMCATGKLFRSSMSGQQVWDRYLVGFGDDPVFRDPASSVHNCNQCNSFVRRYGNIVAVLPDGELTCIFDIAGAGHEYQEVCTLLTNILINTPIADVFVETYDELASLPYESCRRDQTLYKLGIAENHKRYTAEEAEKFGVVKPNEIRTFHHMAVSVPATFVDKSGKSAANIMGDYRDAYSVFKRGMEEISLDTLLLVKDLIVQGSLLNGEAHLHKIEAIVPLKRQYDALSDNKDNWCWYMSHGLNSAKFKNELIGVLCSELSEGKELNEACKAWNIRVDPVNYMKASAPITKKQIEEAKKFIEENGYEASFDRRFATIDDIRVSEILHSNVGDGKIKSVSMFDNVKATSTRHKRSEFDGVEEVGIEKFMSDILPGCASVEAFLLNGHAGNMVSLTTANDKDSKPIFKWNNNYSWTFNGNLTGKSQIKEAVKSRGGNTEGVLNIRLAFPDTTDDYDLHVYEPNRNLIYYGNVRFPHRSSGMLDLDAQGVDGPQPSEKRVENVIYTDLSRMPQGEYQVSVNNYSRRGLRSNFTLEIEADGEVHTLSLKNLTTNNTVDAAKIILQNGVFSVNVGTEMQIVSSNSLSKELYGLDTNQFHKVNLVCLSPNHWEGNKAGNKHYFFMLDGCKTPVSIRSFHNENLIPELLLHRKVTEVLANTTMIAPSDKQLSGLGFNATVKDELVVRLGGTHKRMLKLKF